MENLREYTGECIPKVVLYDLLQCTDQLATCRLDYTVLYCSVLYDLLQCTVQLATGRLNYCSLLDTCVSLTVRQEKAIGSKGKQPCKHKVLEMQINQNNH